jgi:hypothetical protein
MVDRAYAMFADDLGPASDDVTAARAFFDDAMRSVAGVNSAEFIAGLGAILMGLAATRTFGVMRGHPCELSRPMVNEPRVDRALQELLDNFEVDREDFVEQSRAESSPYALRVLQRYQVLSRSAPGSRWLVSGRLLGEQAWLFPLKCGDEYARDLSISRRHFGHLFQHYAMWLLSQRVEDLRPLAEGRAKRAECVSWQRPYALVVECKAHVTNDEWRFRVRSGRDVRYDVTRLKYVQDACTQLRTTSEGIQSGQIPVPSGIPQRWQPVGLIVTWEQLVTSTLVEHEWKDLLASARLPLPPAIMSLHELEWMNVAPASEFVPQLVVKQASSKWQYDRLSAFHGDRQTRGRRPKWPDAVRSRWLDEAKSLLLTPPDPTPP